MEIGSKEIKYLLNPESVEKVIHQYTITPMSMLNLFELQNNKGDKHFAYDYSKRNYETDLAAGILAEPVELTEGSEFPQVSFSGIQEEYGNMTKFGFEVEFTKESAEDPRNLAFFKNCVRDMGMTMMRMINRFSLNNSVSIEELDTGDYIFEENGQKAVFEYKTMPDFINSVMEGRVFNQAIDQQREFANHFVIIEGTDEDRKKICDELYDSKGVSFH